MFELSHREAHNRCLPWNASPDTYSPLGQERTDDQGQLSKAGLAEPDWNINAKKPANDEVEEMADVKTSDEKTMVIRPSDNACGSAECPRKLCL